MLRAMLTLASVPSRRDGSLVDIIEPRLLRSTPRPGVAHIKLHNTSHSRGGALDVTDQVVGYIDLASHGALTRFLGGIRHDSYVLVFNHLQEYVALRQLYAFGDLPRRRGSRAAEGFLSSLISNIDHALLRSQLQTAVLLHRPVFRRSG